MKTISKLLAFSALLGIIFISCQKELSFEAGNSQVSDGSLQADGNGNCLGSVVGGTYKKDSALNATHYVDVSLVVNVAGSYVISTDTLNGYYFRATGTFTATGPQTVRLTGFGKPLATGLNIFTVTYDTTFCEFEITVVAGTGGSAVFTLDGAPGNCTNATVNGTYMVGTALTAANTVVLNVNVTSVGSWSVGTTAVNGMTFSGTGTFTATGSQTITLTGSGTPTAAGTFPVNVTVGTTTCSFNVTCTAPADYFPRTAFSNWSYELNADPNDSVLITSTNQMATIVSNSYRIFMANDGTGSDSSGYYRRNGGNYYEYIDMGTSVGLDDEYWLEYIFLKDDQAAGAFWYSPQFSGTVNNGANNVTVRLKYTILQKDVNAVATGTTYNNTIIVEERLELLTGGNWVDLTTQTGGFSFRYYYSRDIGMIKIEVWDLGTTLSDALHMRRYAVY